MRRLYWYDAVILRLVLDDFSRFFFIDKSRKLSKIVSVLQSASVERFDVSRMRDFHRIGPSGPIRSSSRDVRLSVCMLSLFAYMHLCICLPPLPEVGCLICLEIRNPWGKVLERNGLRIEHFCWEVV